MTSDDVQFIRAEIKRQMHIILSGAAGDNSDTFNEDIQEMVPGMPTITQRPVMHPYGFASRAANGTLQVTARQGDHAGNRLVLGHRAADRPTDLNEGESVVYSIGGYQVRVLKNKLQVGKGNTFETVVVGDTLAKLLGDLLQEISIHTHAAPGAPPTDAAAFTLLKTLNIDTGKILAKDGGRF